ncbi:hypothetical protein LJC26_06690 [Desulfovibrio sp. OttesenSCG-928-O18]|nr:hypothetical protein [Desulfovibrio sp. OttesenSCG-928-O18]
MLQYAPGELSGAVEVLHFNQVEIPSWAKPPRNILGVVAEVGGGAADAMLFPVAVPIAKAEASGAVKMSAAAERAYKDELPFSAPCIMDLHKGSGNGHGGDQRTVLPIGKYPVREQLQYFGMPYRLPGAIPLIGNGVHTGKSYQLLCVVKYAAIAGYAPGPTVAGAVAVKKLDGDGEKEFHEVLTADLLIPVGMREIVKVSGKRFCLHTILQCWFFVKLAGGGGEKNQPKPRAYFFVQGVLRVSPCGAVLRCGGMRNFVQGIWGVVPAVCSRIAVAIKKSGVWLFMQHADSTGCGGGI